MGCGREPALCDRIEDLKLLLNLGKEVKAFGSFEGYAGNVKKRRLAYLIEPLSEGNDER